MKRLTVAFGVLISTALVSWAGVARVVLLPGNESRWLLASVIAGFLGFGAVMIVPAWGSPGRVTLLFVSMAGALFLYHMGLWAAVGILALVGMAVATVGLAFRGSRPQAVRLLVVCAAIFGGMVAGVRLGSALWRARVRRVPVRGSDLVRAIRAHERETQAPPARLADLVPRYLAAIPATGVPDDWHYQTGPFRGRGDVYGYGDNAWVLNVYTGRRGTGFRKAMYLPDQRYPTRYGIEERIGEWAILPY